MSGNPLGIFQHTVATEEDTFRLLQSVNQAMGERAVSEEILKEQFELKWKELDTKLRALPVSREPARTGRTNEETFREIVEAVRAGASKDAVSMEALGTLVRGMNSLLDLANEARVPMSAFSGVGGSVRLRSLLGGAGGFQALQDALAAGSPIAAGPEGASSEERAERARQIRNIREDMERERGSDKPKKGGGEKK